MRVFGTTKKPSIKSVTKHEHGANPEFLKRGRPGTTKQGGGGPMRHPRSSAKAPKY